jgi:hypothetical protein
MYGRASRGARQVVRLGPRAQPPVAESLLSGMAATDVGVLTHRLIAEHLEHRHLDRAMLAERLMFSARAALDGRNSNRRIAIAAQAVTFAYDYVINLAPAAPWRLLACEYDVGIGRVDVAWLGPTRCVVFDEVKTTRTAQLLLDPSWEEQVRAYARAGQLLYGQRFLGVRLIPLGSMQLACLITHGGRPEALAPTPHKPLALDSETKS